MNFFAAYAGSFVLRSAMRQKSVKKGKHLSCSANLVMVTGTVRCQSLHLGGKIMSAFFVSRSRAAIAIKTKGPRHFSQSYAASYGFECWGEEK